jgi:hypothetical protein
MLVALGAALAASTGALFMRERRQGAHLREKMGRLAGVAIERSRLESENRRLRAAIGRAEDSAKARDGRADRDGTQTLVDALQLRVRELKLALGQDADPVWPAGARVAPAGDWAFVGSASPADTLESVLWSARTGNVDRLAGLIAFEPKARDEAAAMFAGLPDEARAQFESPEKVVATYVAAQMPEGYVAFAALAGGTTDPGTAFQSVRIQDAKGGQHDLWFKFGRSDGGWRLLVPESVVARYASQLGSPSAKK